MCDVRLPNGRDQRESVHLKARLSRFTAVASPDARRGGSVHKVQYIRVAYIRCDQPNPAFWFQSLRVADVLKGTKKRSARAITAAFSVTKKCHEYKYLCVSYIQVLVTISYHIHILLYYKYRTCCLCLLHWSSRCARRTRRAWMSLAFDKHETRGHPGRNEQTKQNKTQQHNNQDSHVPSPGAWLT